MSQLPSTPIRDAESPTTLVDYQCARCGLQLQLESWFGSDLEVCDLTPCPYASVLVEQLSPRQPHSVLTDRIDLEMRSQGVALDCEVLR